MGTVMWPQAERSAVCLLKEEKHNSGLLIRPHLGVPGSAPVFALAAWLRLRKVVGLEHAMGQLWLSNPSRAGLAGAELPRKQLGPCL